MVMDREKDGDSGSGAAVPLSLDEIDLRSVCDSFCEVPLFVVAMLQIIY
jgi:hypothetical protein